MPRFTDDEYKEILKKPAYAKASLLQYEAERQKRQNAQAETDKPTESESLIQQKGVELARDYLALKGFSRKCLIAIPNGGHVTDANRMRLTKEGMTAGVLDLELRIARGGYHALFIEVKRPKQKLRSAQEERIGIDAAQGYKSVVVYSAAEIFEAIKSYID